MFGTILQSLFMLVGLLTFATKTIVVDDTNVSFSKSKADKNGFLIHSIKSPYQQGETLVRVLLPEKIKQGKKYQVLYVLPVEAKNGNRYGDGLLELKKQNLHNKYGLICVAPTFSHLPWYADHPNNLKIRQESYLLKAIVPNVDKNYPTIATKEGRFLLGFSKSGCGAFSLLLRNPNVFHKAAAWDAPLNMQDRNKYGAGAIFATQENFEKYQISKLLTKNAKQLGNKPRLISIGYGNFRKHHEETHKQMDRLKIKHVYQDGPKYKHHWNSGWVAGAVNLLMK